MVDQPIIMGNVAELQVEIRQLHEVQASMAVLISDLSRQMGEAKGALKASEQYNLIDGWRTRAERAEAALKEARQSDVATQHAPDFDKIAVDLLTKPVNWRVDATIQTLERPPILPDISALQAQFAATSTALRDAYRAGIERAAGIVEDVALIIDNPSVRNGGPSRDARRAAADIATARAARDAAWEFTWAARESAWAAASAAWAAASAAWAAASAAWAAEESWQFDRLIAWMGAVEPEDWPLPARRMEP